jgi:F-type H+-transporting ATPase subunit b
VDLNWSTFVLEIINFLVLVWVLKRFFYKPVLGVIERRRAAIEETLATAKSTQTAAESLQQKYEGRLADWERERERSRSSFSAELEAERVRALAGLKTELEQEREKARVVSERRDKDAQRKIEETAMLQASQFAAQLLERAAGPELEARLIDSLIAEISDLPAERVASLRGNYGQAPDEIAVVTAFPLPAERRPELERALSALTGLEIPVRYVRDGALLAGIRIVIGSWRLSADLDDELRAFAELAHAD